MFRDILSQLPGRRITQVTRASDESAEIAGQWYGLKDPERLFRYAPGPVFLTFDSGPIIGFNSRASQCSVFAWRAGKEGPTPEDFPHHFAYELTATIASVELYREAPRNSRFAPLQRESTVILHYVDLEPMALVHGLHDNSDDFAVVSPEQILPYFKLDWRQVEHWRMKN